VFRQSGRMQFHLSKCRGGPFVCEVCRFEGATRKEVNRHKSERHADELPFRCDDCDARFRRNTSLQVPVFFAKRALVSTPQKSCFVTMAQQKLPLSLLCGGNDVWIIKYFRRNIWRKYCRFLLKLLLVFTIIIITLVFEKNANWQSGKNRRKLWSLYRPIFNFKFAVDQFLLTQITTKPDLFQKHLVQKHEKETAADLFQCDRYSEGRPDRASFCRLDDF
jgi:hypothetical protein